MATGRALAVPRGPATPRRRVASRRPVAACLLAALCALATTPRVHAAGAEPLLWWRDGRATTQALALLAQLEAAGDHGLDAADYAAPALRRQFDAPAGARAPGEAALQAADRALSRAALAFVHDLHYGRVEPARMGLGMPARAPLDGPALLARLAASRDLPAELAAFEPRFLHYQLLEAALHRYRALAADARLAPLPPLGRRALREGDTWQGAPALRRLLRAFGDLGDGATAGAGGGTVDADPADPDPVDPERIDPGLAAGLRRYQLRHGLAADGVLARRTWESLATPLRARVRQIELTLERWRWLPAFTAPPVIVNIPQFQLYAFRSLDDRAVDIAQMPVIVGQSYQGKRTPLLVTRITQVVFRPYWDVPASIVRAEMLAPMRANAAFLARNHLEIVRGGGDDASVQPPTAASIDALAAGALRLRQLPGDDNALGPVKFVMPNDQGIYLHGTPTRRLFGRARRDLSHGCIRLSDPAALAVHVLRANAGGWDAAAVAAAMQSGAPGRRVTVAADVPVMILYATTLATEAGTVLFFDDIYGHDRRLEQLLRQRRR